ncbi:putative MscS family protein YkuT [Thalassocella blandensis]|nr:putative MscS family protein YkuT [Thalassocella blandensis]
MNDKPIFGRQHYLRRLLICICIMLSATSLVFSHSVLSQNLAEVAESVSDNAETQEGDSSAIAETSESQDDSTAEDKETAEEFSLGLNIAETINVEEAVHSWDKKLNQALQKFGIDKSWFGRLIGTLAILLITFICWIIVNQGTKFFKRKASVFVQRYHITQRHLDFNFRLVRIFLKIALAVIAIASVSSILQIPVFSLLSEENVYWLLQSIVSIFAILMLASILIALAGNLVEKAFDKFGESNNARIQTLVPITKNLIFVVVFVLFGLTLLSELGINVMPLLAGAGVVGFAIGFGAQTFFKDLITGFIIVIEDLVQVGDVIRVGDRSGLVEKITIRKIQLRNLEGIVSTVPFSEIGIVDNFTKLFSYYLMNVGVAYRENTDEVINLLKQVDEEMREDENYKDNILEPIEILGVDAFADSAVIIKARIKTRPIKQWEVGREFNRRMKFLFDEQGVEIPFPHQTIYFGEDKDGSAPPMNLRMDESIELLEKKKTDERPQGEQTAKPKEKEVIPGKTAESEPKEKTGYDKESKIQKDKEAEENARKLTELEKKRENDDQKELSQEDEVNAKRKQPQIQEHQEDDD